MTEKRNEYIGTLRELREEMAINRQEINSVRDRIGMEYASLLRCALFSVAEMLFSSSNVKMHLLSMLKKIFKKFCRS